MPVIAVDKNVKMLAIITLVNSRPRTMATTQTKLPNTFKIDHTVAQK